MSRLFFVLIGLSSFFVLFFYSILTHPFEVPDEQSHYATVHYLASEGQMPILTKHSDLSLEEENTEYIFGIMSEGNNKYSYHPEFRMDYIPGLRGLYESKISSFNTPQYRRTYTIHQAAIYPPLYYWVTYPFYQAVNSSGIITRLFVSRLASVILTMFTIISTFFIGKLIFDKRSYGLTLALMTLFFPMTVYLGSGVSSDNLHNLLFTFFFYFSIKYLKSGWSIRDSLVTGFIIALDILTKPQAYIMFPLLALVIMVRGSWQEWRLTLKNVLVLALTVLVIAGWYKQPQYLDTGATFVAQSLLYGGWSNFQVFVKQYASLFTGAMLVWYWGVFKWFGIVLPRPVWWVANRLVIVAGVGLILSVWQSWKNRKNSFLLRIVIFTILANLTYLCALLWFDWQFYQQIGRSLGFQARYLMPLLSTQMFLLLYGLTSLGWSTRIRELIRKTVIVFFFGLHLAGLFTMISSYYDLLPLSRLIEQMSQYKPIYAKGSWWYLYFSLYFTGIITTSIMALKSDTKK